MNQFQRPCTTITGAADFLENAFDRSSSALFEGANARTAWDQETSEAPRSFLAHAEQFAGFGTWNYDFARRVVTLSERSQRLLGSRERKLTIRHACSFVHPDDLDRVRATADWSVRAELPVDSEFRVVRPLGEVRFVRSQLACFRDAAGRLESMIGILQDVTENRLARAESRQRNLVCDRALELARIGGWEIDLTTSQTVWSDSLQRILEIDPENAPKTTAEFRDLVHPADIVLASEVAREAIAAKTPFEFRARFILPGGRVRILHTCAVPSLDDSGRVTSLFGMSQDVTESFKSEEELRRISCEVMHLRDQERRRMARHLHESASQSVAALKMTLNRVHETLPKTNDLTHALLQSATLFADQAMSEIRTISYLMHPPTLDSSGLGSALRWFAEGFSKRSGVSVTVHIPDDFGRLAQETETLIFRVVQEALSNVHRHSESQTASIELLRQNGHVRVEIADQGRGMGDTLAQGDLAPPLGVGIAGIRERVRQLNGVFEIQSEIGKGTRLSVELPARLESY
jgi:PAS domain S-box-containing protein